MTLKPKPPSSLTTWHSRGRTPGPRGAQRRAGSRAGAAATASSTRGPLARMRRATCTEGGGGAPARPPGTCAPPEPALRTPPTAGPGTPSPGAGCGLTTSNASCATAWSFTARIRSPSRRPCRWAGAPGSTPHTAGPAPPASCRSWKPKLPPSSLLSRQKRGRSGHSQASGQQRRGRDVPGAGRLVPGGRCPLGGHHWALGRVASSRPRGHSQPRPLSGGAVRDGGLRTPPGRGRLPGRREGYQRGHGLPPGTGQDYQCPALG